MFRNMNSSDAMELQVPLEAGIDLLCEPPLTEVIALVGATESPHRRRERKHPPPPPWRSKHTERELDTLETEAVPVDISASLQTFPEVPCARSHALGCVALIARKDDPSHEIPVLIVDMESRGPSSMHAVQYIRGSLVGVEAMREFGNEYDVVFTTKHVKRLVARVQAESFLQRVRLKFRARRVGSGRVKHRIDPLASIERRGHPLELSRNGFPALVMEQHTLRP